MDATGTDLVRRLFDEVFNQRDFGCLDEIVAPEYVEHAHAPFGLDEPGAVNGPEHMRGVVDWLTDQFPDMRMTLLDLVGDGDTVAARVLSEGTNTGLLNGFIPATGKSFSAEQSHWYCIAGGKLAEHWATRDDLRTMQQLGVVQPGPSE
jgi:predicted ester cyclase